MRKLMYIILCLRIKRTLKRMERLDDSLQNMYLIQSWYNSHLGIYW